MAQKFSTLTRANMRKLESGQTVMEHGIQFERMSDGDGRFSVNVMVDGKRIHRVLGRESEGVTRQQVEDFVEKVKTEARQDRLSLQKGRKIGMSVEAAVEKYLEQLALIGGKDLAKKRERLKLHVVPFFKNKVLTQLTSFDLDRYKKARADEGAASGTINRELAVISHLLNRAVEWKWMEVNPVKIRRLQEDSGRITYLTVSQANHLVETALKDSNPQMYLFSLIGLETSMRRMEILSIRLTEIDLERRVIYIPKAKGGAREQPITASLTAALRRELAQASPGQEWLFPSKKSHTGHTMWPEASFRRIVSEAGLDTKEVTPHIMRHTAITHLVQDGVDLPTVQRISGHKTLQMVARYSHQNGDHIRAAMDRLEMRYRDKPEGLCNGDTITQELHRPPEGGEN